jgi:hypothetical protein
MVLACLRLGTLNFADGRKPPKLTQQPRIRPPPEPFFFFLKKKNSAVACQAGCVLITCLYSYNRPVPAHDAKNPRARLSLEGQRCILHPGTALVLPGQNYSKQDCEFPFPYKCCLFNHRQRDRSSQGGRGGLHIRIVEKDRRPP